MATSEEKKKKETEKEAFPRRLFDVQDQMQLVASIRAKYRHLTITNTAQNSESQKKLLWEQLKKNNDLKFKNLNDKTLNTLIAFAIDIPQGIQMKEGDFKNKSSITTWLTNLPPYDYNALNNLHENLAQLEKNKKLSERWSKASTIINVIAQAIAPLAQVPLLHIVMHPIMNGLWGVGYITYGIAMGYDPGLGDRTDTLQSNFDKASFGTGLVALGSAILMLLPITWPITIPTFLFSMLTSNILAAASSIVDFVKSAKSDKNTESAKWRLAQKSTSLLYTIGTVVIVALMITAFFTPVGWAAAAGALTFGIATAAACLAAIGISQFCKWRADKAEKREKTAAEKVGPDQKEGLEKKISESKKETEKPKAENQHALNKVIENPLENAPNVLKEAPTEQKQEPIHQEPSVHKPEPQQKGKTLLFSRIKQALMPRKNEEKKVSRAHSVPAKESQGPKSKEQSPKPSATPDKKDLDPDPKHPGTHP